jgi:hypothetical protein
VLNLLDASSRNFHKFLDFPNLSFGQFEFEDGEILFEVQFGGGPNQRYDIDLREEPKKYLSFGPLVLLGDVGKLARLEDVGVGGEGPETLVSDVMRVAEFADLHVIVFWFVETVLQEGRFYFCS